MFTTSSPATVSTVSTRSPDEMTVTEKVAVAALYSSSLAAVAVIVHTPAPARVSAPVPALTAHTVAGDAE